MSLVTFLLYIHVSLLSYCWSFTWSMKTLRLSFSLFSFFTRKTPLVYLFRPGTCKIVLTNERYVCCCVVHVHVCWMICVYVYVPMCMVSNAQIFAPTYGSPRNLWVCSSAALHLIFWEKVSSWTWISLVIWGRLASGLQRTACSAPASLGRWMKAWSCYMGTGDPDSQPYIFPGTTWWVGNISPLQTWILCKFFERKMLASFLSPFKGGGECQWSVKATILATEMFCGGHHMVLQPRILLSCR